MAVPGGQQPRVTVAIPTYNRSPLLRQTLASVLAQTYDDFEVVVADNASTDDTEAVAREAGDPRIRYVRRPENLGLVGNWNACMAEAGGEHVLVLSDDDLLRPDYLARAVRALDAEPRAGVVHTSFALIDGHGAVLEPHANWTYGLGRDTVEEPATFVRESMAHSCRICTSTALMRRVAIPAGGMDAGDLPAVDFGLWLRMAAAGWSVGFLHEPLACYRIHGGSFSATEYGPALSAGYVYSRDAVDKVLEVKRRFLDGWAADEGERRALSRLAEEAARWELIVVAGKQTLDRPGLRGRRLRFVTTAARLDAGTLRSGALWRAVAADATRPLRRRLRRPRETQAAGS